MQLLDDFKETTGYWKLKYEEPDRTPWRTHYERGYGPAVRQTTGINLKTCESTAARWHVTHDLASQQLFID